MIEDREVCRDIVSDAFEHTWRIFCQKEQFNATGYMYSLVRNKCIDYIRHETAKARYADLYMHMYGEGFEEDNACEEAEQQISQIYRVLEELTPKTRRILKMCYFQRKTYSQTAVELGISVSAVRKHIVNALKTFRAAIAKKDK